MSEIPEKWLCDVCGESIDSADQGYVIWQIDDDAKASNFKIVHVGKCDLQGFPASTALNDFTGTQGLTKLLSSISLGPIKNHINNARFCKIADLDEFVDLIRRIHIPYYEEARRHFSNPELIDEFADANEIAPYLPDTLKDIVDRY